MFVKKSNSECNVLIFVLGVVGSVILVLVFMGVSNGCVHVWVWVDSRKSLAYDYVSTCYLTHNSQISSVGVYPWFNMRIAKNKSTSPRGFL